MKKGGTYFDKLMKDKKFKELFEKEYAKILISEKRAKLRKETNRARKRSDSDMPIGKLIRIKDSLPSPTKLAKSKVKCHNIRKQGGGR